MSTTIGDPPEDGAAGREARHTRDARAQAGLAPAPETVSSEALLGGRTQLAIRHRQTVYFLRQTRYGKLILTK